MMWGWGYNGGYDIFVFVFMVLFMALIAIGIIAVVRRLNHRTNGMQSTESPLDTLKRRYANGEIDKKEFDEKRKDLGA